MDEAKMTDADMAQREKIVKSMKKSFKDFRKRYGSDAKNVMYATATKMAMKEEETIEEGEVKKMNKEKKNEYVSSIIQKKLHPSVLPSKAYGRRKLKEAVKDEADKGEYDYEGDMAKSSLRTIIRNAQMMHDMLDENTNLPEWVASKITLAEDYLVSAAQYMQSEMSEEVELDEISSYKASRAADASWHMNTRNGQPVAQGYKKLRRVDTHPYPGKDGKLGSKSREKSEKQHQKFRSYAKKKIEMGEANLTPYRNTERIGVRSTKKAGLPRMSNAKQFWRPPEGFTQKGIEKGKGKVTTPVYKKKTAPAKTK